MPPSPSFRCSPMRERRMESSHNRGRSLESRFPLSAKDDDLALFSDVQNKESDNFLLHTSYDLDDSISKLRYFSDFKVGITIPAQGECSDLLNADGEKNDYDWLLTPPDTPLFHSLDDDEHQPVNLLPRGRPRSQPVSISGSSTSKRTHQTSRSSASPHRLSPSPGSGNSLVPSRGRTSSAPRASPPPVLRPTTPTRRPFTPPSKPSTPTQRSSTPSLRRMSTGSSVQTSSSGKRGGSPLKTSRGSSSSPKLRGWQVNLDGFSSDVPTNLRTSLSDRPAAYTRGSSPSSRNGRDLSSKFGRQSISPTASRSASSSNSHERDRLSTYSKASVASSSDDIDYLHSVGISSNLTTRRNGVIVNNKTIPFSKKPSRTVSANSAPKRSFNSALQQMDHHRTPQNMFRPLLSSVPATTFFVGKSNSTHRPMFSRNSSLTTSSNASSEQGASFVPDMEGSEHDQNDLTDEWERKQDPDIQEEIFTFEKVDDINDDDGHKTFSQNGDENFDVSLTNKVNSFEVESFTNNSGDAASVATALESSYAFDEHPEASGNEMKTCSRCGSKFWTMEVIASAEICLECAKKDWLLNLGEHGTSFSIIKNETVHLGQAIDIDGLCVETKVHVSEPPTKSNNQVMLDQDERNHKLDCAADSCPPRLVFNQKEQNHSVHQLGRQQDIGTVQSESKPHQPHVFTPIHKIGSPERTGISVLLQSSSSGKWPLVQGRTFNATSILSSEPSYARDNSSVMKRSISRDSTSASSSVDLGSVRQTEDRVQCQLSIKKIEMDNLVNDAEVGAQKITSDNEVSIDTSETAFHTKSETGQNFSNSTEDDEYEAFRETGLITGECKNFQEKVELCAAQSLPIETSDLVDTSGENNPDDEDCTSCVSAEEDLPENSRKINQDIEQLKSISDIEEKYMLNGTCPIDSYNDATRSSSTVILEPGNEYDSFHYIQTERVPSENPNGFLEPSASITSEKGMLVSALESYTVDHANGILEETTVTVERPCGHMSRSLTLEEVTDTILFCSSIIHDVAYKAASIGMEKVLMMHEASGPMPTIMGNSGSNQRESRKSTNRSSPKAQKFKRKPLETQTKAKEPEDNVKFEESIPFRGEVQKRTESAKPPKLESKCNCTIM